MPHIQQQILDRIAVVLAGAAIVPAGRVHLERVDPLPEGQLPALHIEEPPEGETTQPATVHGLDARDMLVDVHCHTAATVAWQQAARQLGLQVEKAIAGDLQLRTRLCRGGVRCIGSRPLRSGDGANGLAERQLRFRCTYYCDRKTPDVPV